MLYLHIQKRLGHCFFESWFSIIVIFFVYRVPIRYKLKCLIISSMSPNFCHISISWSLCTQGKLCQFYPPNTNSLSLSVSKLSHNPSTELFRSMTASRFQDFCLAPLNLTLNNLFFWHFCMFDMGIGSLSMCSIWLFDSDIITLILQCNWELDTRQFGFGKVWG